MVWIKRNLLFVISVAVGLLLTGYCGYLLYNSLDANSGVSDDYKTTLGNLEGFQQKVPYPSKENIQAVKADEDRVRSFLAEFRKSFAAFPPTPVEDDQGFKIYLGENLARFRAEAADAGVQLPPDYDFSFSGLIGKLNYSPGSITPWMRELQEMGAILKILYQAKINYLAALCRVPVSIDDTGSVDCLLQATTVTNQWGVVTPYKITFRGFSTEVAAVMEGFARSSNCFIIKAIDVAPDTTVQPIVVQTVAQSQPAAPAYAPPARNPYAYQNPSLYPGERRGGPPGGRPFQNPYMQPPVNQAPAVPNAVPAMPAAPAIILTENPLLVTISVDVVKLKTLER
jgi:hypothetical protein